MSGGLRFRSKADLPDSMRKLLEAQDNAPFGRADAAARSADGVPRRKYGNQITRVDGIVFHSKKEARYYEQLKLRQQAGEVWFWLRQVSVHLPGGTKYVLDFLVFYKDGHCDFVDVKGRETKEFKIKKREVEHHYPFKILLA